MNISNITGIKSNENAILKELDKKIILKTFQDHGKIKTQVKGVDNFLNEKELNDFIRNVKVKNGCNGNITIENGTKLIIFTGDQIDTVKSYIINNKITTKEYIK